MTVTARKTKYQQAVEWIAFNDEPSVLDSNEIANMLTVALVADVWGVRSYEVADEIAEIRKAAARKPQ